MRWLAIIGLLLVGLTFASPMPVGGGWLWDTGNGFGFSALALMLYLYIDSGRGRGAKRHQALAWLAVGAGAIHAAYFIVLDSTSITLGVYRNRQARPGQLTALLQLITSRQAHY